ncbi:flagellar hook-associated protein FlgK [Pseudodonghicola flavimaris]|uniref:Flagellar hook-associated protein 1 n=1 Tax=Pseudodonghicola flavimaris TaxID=3050036 RepID=A0ABT7EWJ6_9RHOB|nr:flagellar hook-associated protein FlgK [Pseudodonghicola flavimaris]MDK3016721.1 flagellar hook-associated protein FlgK [Pseudodonghicola flavimaris]
MSLSRALNVASSGLATAQFQTQVVSENIANAMSEDYVRREAVLITTHGGASSVAAVQREVDSALIRMSRAESAKMAHQQAIYEALDDYTVYLGQPGDGLSVSDKFSDFNTALTTLVNMPSSTEAQSAAVYAAEDLATSIRDLSGTLSEVRSDVEMEIRYEVSDLNQALYDLADLNSQMGSMPAGTLAAAEVADQMDALLDQVSGIVGVRISYNSDSTVSVYTTGGAALLEGTQVQDVSYNAGEGTFFAGEVEITPNKDGVRGIEEGSLVGFAELTNEILPQFQLQLDEYARALIQAFESSDTSLAAGEAGLFTDNGAAYDPDALDGLASRLTVNSKVSHDGDAEIWRIRDGMGVTSEGAAADATQIQRFIDVFDTKVDADPATGLSASISLADFASELVSAQASESTRAENSYSAASSAAELVAASRESVEGVNIDDELQKLLLIEQSYAANSKMLTAVAEMLDTLLAAV